MTSPSRGKARVLVYVQHLLGIGHVRRAAAMVRALGEAGSCVDVVCGGAPVAGVDFGAARLNRLPALRSADAGFSRLVTARGAEPDEGFRGRRRRRLLAIAARLRPHAVIVETFPFGRRQMRFELLPLLDAVHAMRPRPRVVCSVRDIVQARKPARIAESVAIVQSRFDRVWVHGDPRFVRFEESFPAADEIAGQLDYTGFVLDREPAVPAPAGVGADEVIVSAGGGAAAGRIYRAALEARALSALAEHTWRLLVGPNVDEEEFRTLRRAAPRGVVVERNRPDFRALLSRCAVSVSQAGYNTVMDVLAAGAPALLIPFAGAGESEQPLRARRLEQLGRVGVAGEHELDAATLARALDRLVQGGGVPALELDLDGARRCAGLLQSLLAAAGVRPPGD